MEPVSAGERWKHRIHAQDLVVEVMAVKGPRSDNDSSTVFIREVVLEECMGTTMTSIRSEVMPMPLPAFLRWFEFFRPAMPISLQLLVSAAIIGIEDDDK